MGVVDAAIAVAQPMVIVEFGTYVGYPAVRFAAQLQEGAHLFSIDQDPKTQAADNVLAFTDKVDDYLDHVRNSGSYHFSRTYTTTLEYDGRGPDEALVDGVEVSV